MATQTKRNLIRFLVVAVVFFAFSTAHAATLYLVPSGNTQSVGQSFTVDVFASSADQAMNAAQGNIIFPIDKLSVISVSKLNSMMTLWVQDPSFSNQDGRVNFEGVVVNPGFIGTGGKILSITFRVKSTGTAALSFSSGAVLANDGKGTNITSGMNGTSIALVEAPPAGAAIGSGPAGITPASPISTNPATVDGTWYNFNALTFLWRNPSDAAAVSYATSVSPVYQMPISARPLTSQVSYSSSAFPDGVWYFYLSFNRSFGWTAPVAKRVQIDRTPPEPFTITQVYGGAAANEPEFRWSTSDRTSGVTHYLAKVGDGDWFDPSTILHDSTYILPPQSATRARVLVVQAYDAAGNFRASELTFEVLPSGGLPLWYYDAVDFIALWWWLMVIFAIIACLLVYLIYSFVKWRLSFKMELEHFREQIWRDMTILEGEAQSKGKHDPKDIRDMEHDIKEEEKRISDL